jgi:hypothetical protein
LCISPSPKPGEKAPAHPLQEAVEAFLLTKRVAGCADTTLRTRTPKTLPDVPTEHELRAVIATEGNPFQGRQPKASTCFTLLRSHVQVLRPTRRMNLQPQGDVGHQSPRVVRLTRSPP